MILADDRFYYKLLMWPGTKVVSSSCLCKCCDTVLSLVIMTFVQVLPITNNNNMVQKRATKQESNWQFLPNQQSVILSFPIKVTIINNS